MIDEMPGIDGMNPLGWLAALGVLTLVGGMMYWRQTESGWIPVLERDSETPLVETLIAKLGIVTAPPIEKRKKGRPKLETATALKNTVPFGYVLSDPPCDDFQGNRIVLATAETLRTALDHSAPADVERIVAHAGIADGGALDATVVRDLAAGGQIRYLRVFREIIESVRPEHIEEAIYHWRYRVGPKTSLDPSSDLGNVGLEITDIGAVSALGAERLTIEGLRSMPTAPQGRRLMTRGFSRGANRRWRLRWFLWEMPLSLDAIRICMGAQGLHDDDLERIAQWAQAVGIAAVVEAEKYRPSKMYARLRRSQVLFERLGTTTVTQGRSTQIV